MPYAPPLHRSLPGWLLLLLVLAAHQAYAQRPTPAVVRVTGVVLANADRRPVPGAGVFIAGTGTGTAADVTGAFLITLPRNDTLVFRAIGFRSRLFTVKVSTPDHIAIEVLLDIDSVRLGEVVITADRPDRPEINRALRAIKRPSKATPVPQKTVGKPLFQEPEVTAGMAPTILENPISVLYEQFSREGRQRRKLAEWQEQKAAEDAEKRRQEYNKAFRNSSGY